MPRFNHLHAHSHYSLLSALPKIEDLVKTAKETGCTALALTDNGNLYGAIEFYKECKKAEIKPILGVDFYIAPRTRKDKEHGIDSRRNRLVILAKDLIGYKNLMRLVTDSYLEGFYYKPRIDRELLEKYHEGLVAILPAINGPLSLAVQTNDSIKIEEILGFYKKTFGSDVYLEISKHDDIENHAEMMKRTVEASRKTKTQIVAGQEVYYLKPEDKIAQRTMMLVSSSGGDNLDRSSLEDDGDFSFITPETADEWFRDYPEAIENAGKISDMCNLKLELGKWAFPDFKLPPGVTSDEEFRRIVFEGFSKRKVEKNQKTLERVEYELKVIKGKGYAPYFLIVADLLAYARTHGILSNIRGSVSGSMVTYLAGITNIDPLEYEIPFERFLNPDRPSAPDIDMDFADNRRDEMVEYARQKYGHDKVAQIGTFGTMAARGSVRDITRALGFPIELGDKISKMIPMGSQGFPMTIDHALEMVPELKELYTKDQDINKIINLAKKIEGCARHISVHAAGIVIAPTELTDFTPLQYDTKGDNKIITQYDMYSIDEEGAGLLKFDFLGLKNLSILADCIDRIEKIEGKKIDVENVPLDDEKVFKMLANGDTEGLFQLNGDGMTKYLKDLKPTTVHDINAMVALYRPGPIQFIPLYIERKHGRSKVEYPDPALEPILEKTYGVLVYQDDLLMIAHKIAGYNWGELDKFRKAVGKKIPAEMAAQKEKFIKGCVTTSKWPEKKAKALWLWIEPFAAYGFNKAHSVSYGKVAYETAYMKANFPAIYMSAVLTADSGNVEEIGEMIGECKRMGIPVLPPSVNESYSDFTVVRKDSEPDRIRFGLTTIKNFGEGIAKFIIHERKTNGKFKSLTDFLSRIQDRNLNKKSLESLIKAGAMDEFGERGQLLKNIDRLLQYNKESGATHADQDSLFGAISSGSDELTLAPTTPIDPGERLLWEKELLGLYISGHPLDKYRGAIEKMGTNIAKLKEIAMKEKEKTGKITERTIVIAGTLEDIRVIRTKKEEEMCFGRFADLTGFIDTVFFPRTYAQSKLVITKDSCLAIKGKVNDRNGELSFVVDTIKKLG